MRRGREKRREEGWDGEGEGRDEKGQAKHEDEEEVGRDGGGGKR